MNIVKPGPGDLVDRLSILAIKIPKMRFAGHDVQHLMEEQDEILQWLQAVPPEALALGRDLKRVNLLLWEATDKQYSPDLASLDRDQLLSLHLDLKRLNLERNRLREAIDHAAGAFRGREKLD